MYHIKCRPSRYELWLADKVSMAETKSVMEYLNEYEVSVDP